MKQRATGSAKGRGLRAVVLATALAVLGGSCAFIDVSVLSSDGYEGRANNTAGSVLAQNYLIGVLTPIASGANTGAADPWRQSFASGTNVVALIPGTDLADEYVMIGAHYDHLGGACEQVDPGDTVCNGATDNATGVASVLAIARHLANPANAPRRSVLLTFWDREEDGLLGSAAYVANPLVPLADTVAYINFDIQGANLLPSLRNYSFAVASETGGPVLEAAVQSAVDSQPLQSQRLSSIFGQGRSDYAVLIDAGVPSVFFSDSSGPCYHTTADDLSVVDFSKLDQQMKIGIELSAGLVDGSVTPTFNGSAPVATYADAVALDGLVASALADLDLFSPADQATVQAYADTVSGIVADGVSGFGPEDLGPLLGGASAVVSILASGECDGYLAPPSGQLDVLTYNVAGLPAPLSGSTPEVNTPLIAPLLNDFDLVLLQESWKTPVPNSLDPLRVYHEILEAGSTHSFQSLSAALPLGTDPSRPTAQFSDGLNRFSNLDSSAVSRTPWSSCNGVLDGASDCLAFKGFSMSTLTLADDVTVEVVNLHAEAGGGAADEAVRAQNYVELAASINGLPSDTPFIVAGDFNLHGDDPVDAAVLTTFLNATNLTDACAALACTDTDRIDRVLYRSGADLTFTPVSWEADGTTTFVDGNGVPLSDHLPVNVVLDWHVPEG